MATTVSYRPLNPDDVRAMRYVIIETAVEYGCYGIHAALSLVAIAILVRHRGRRPGFMLAVVNILLTFSFIAVIGNTIYYLIQFPPGFGTSTRDIWEISANWDITTAVVKRFNYVASDAIVAWRVWIIWRDSRLVKAILLLCMCGSLVVRYCYSLFGTRTLLVYIYLLTFHFRSPIVSRLPSDLLPLRTLARVFPLPRPRVSLVPPSTHVTRLSTGSLLHIRAGLSLAGAIIACVWTVQSDKADKFVTTLQSMTLLITIMFTNVVTTVLVGLKIWYYRREIKGCLGLFTRKSLAEKVLVTFLESGCLYILIWTAYIVVDVILGNDGFTAINFIGSAMPSVAGIYLTIVVIVIMNTKEQQNLISSAQISRAMRVAGAIGNDTSSKQDPTGGEVSAPQTASALACRRATTLRCGGAHEL